MVSHWDDRDKCKSGVKILSGDLQVVLLTEDKHLRWRVWCDWNRCNFRVFPFPSFLSHFQDYEINDPKSMLNTTENKGIDLLPRLRYMEWQRNMCLCVCDLLTPLVVFIEYLVWICLSVCSFRSTHGGAFRYICYPLLPGWIYEYLLHVWNENWSSLKDHVSIVQSFKLKPEDRLKSNQGWWRSQDGWSGSLSWVEESGWFLLLGPHIVEAWTTIWPWQDIGLRCRAFPDGSSTSHFLP